MRSRAVPVRKRSWRGDEHGAARTYGLLGIIAGLQVNYEEAGRWLVRCDLTFIRCNDPHDAVKAARNFLIFYKKAPPEARETLETMWKGAGLGELPAIKDEGEKSS